MKNLSLIGVLILALIVVQPAHAQVDCTPPQDAQIVATNLTGQWVAWALGNSVTWCGNGVIVSTAESTYLDILYWDGYWLPYNLYFGSSVDGYLFQMNVVTGQGYLISPHGQPPGDPGEGGGGNAVAPPVPDEVVVPTVHPRQAGLTLWQWIGYRIGW